MKLCVNTESKECLFKSAESAAKCTDRKPENMLPGILKRLQLKRENIGSDPIKQLSKRNSRINTHAEGLTSVPRHQVCYGLDEEAFVCLASSPEENFLLFDRRKGSLVAYYQIR